MIRYQVQTYKKVQISYLNVHKTRSVDTAFHFKFLNLNTHHEDNWMKSCELDRNVKRDLDNSYLKSKKIALVHSFHSRKCSTGTHKSKMHLPEKDVLRLLLRLARSYSSQVCFH